MKYLLFLSAAVAALCQTPADSPAPSVIAASGGAVGGDFRVTVQNLDKWPKDPKNLRLFLDGREIHGLEPFQASKTTGVLAYELRMCNVGDASTMDRATRAGWINAFRHTSGDTNQRAVAVSVGEAGSKDPFPSNQSVSLEMPRTWFTFAITLVAIAVLLLTIYLGWKYELLRDTSNEELPPGKKWCFSLGRCQMAAWFVLVVGAYLYLYAVTEMSPVITASILTLIGISAATGVSGYLIDSQRRDSESETRRGIFAERAGLVSRVTAVRQALLPPGVPAGGGTAAAPALAAAVDLTKELQEKESRLAAVEGQIRVLPPAPAPPFSTGSFFKDILSDNGAISIHRFQMFVWTIVLGIIFVRSVLQDYMMPDFDATLLGLMGISSGTFIAFKIPNQPKPVPPTP